MKLSQEITETVVQRIYNDFEYHDVVYAEKIKKFNPEYFIPEILKVLDELHDEIKYLKELVIPLG